MSLGRQFRASLNTRGIRTNASSFMPAIAGTSGRLHSDFFLEFYSYRLIGKLTAFAASGVQSAQSNMGAFYHFHRAAFSSMLKSRVSSIFAKAAVLRINLNLDGEPIASKCVS